MSQYLEVKRQIAALEAKAEKLRAAEIKNVIGGIKSKISEYALTVADLFAGSAPKAAPAGKKIARPAKYRDPKTGAEWGGIGKPPKWIAAAALAGKKDAFLIDRQEAKAAPKPAAKAAPKAAVTKAEKPAPKAAAKKAEKAAPTPVAKALSKAAPKAKEKAAKAPAKVAVKRTPKAAVKKVAEEAQVAATVVEAGAAAAVASPESQVS